MQLETPVRKERSPWEDAWYQLTRNRVAMGSLVFIFLLIVVAVFANVIAPFHFAEGSLEDNYALPGDKFLVGADFMGRDILSRTIYGARVSVSVAIVAGLVSLLVGLTIGVISGYVGGRVDNILMRIVDIIYAYPFIVFVILMQVYFKALSRRGGAEGFAGALIELDSMTGGMLFVFFAIGLINWLQMARLARGQVLSYKEKEFVEAAHSIGASDGRIIFRHLLPNIIGPSHYPVPDDSGFQLSGRWPARRPRSKDEGHDLRLRLVMKQDITWRSPRAKLTRGLLLLS